MVILMTAQPNRWQPGMWAVSPDCRQRRLPTRLPLSAAITIIVGTFVSGGTQATNWSRFAKNGRIGFYRHPELPSFLGNGFLIFSRGFLRQGLWGTGHCEGDGPAGAGGLGG
jgi:hypothetical protein